MKLTESQINMITVDRSNGLTIGAIAKKYNLNNFDVYRAVKALQKPFINQTIEDTLGQAGLNDLFIFRQLKDLIKKTKKGIPVSPQIRHQAIQTYLEIRNLIHQKTSAPKTQTNLFQLLNPDTKSLPTKLSVPEAETDIM